MEKTEAAQYCSRLQSEVAEPGLDFGAVSQANGSLKLPAFWEMELGRGRKFPSRDFVWDDGNDITKCISRTGLEGDSEY